VPPTTHLTRADYDELGRELDGLRREVVDGLGAADARYIRRLIAAQRGLEVAARAVLLFSSRRWAWWTGTAALSVAKILENMEIGHNVLHGQWNWMRDERIHSTTWEWDTACPADQWKHSHNVVHHTFTNVLGKDRDVGYGILRVTPEQEWRPIYLAQPLYNVLLAMFYEYGIALHDLAPDLVESGEKTQEEFDRQLREIGHKAGRQFLKDYVAFPLLAGPNALPVLLANLAANTVRNAWAHTVIFCGHFPGDIEVFEEAALDGETRGEWYVRQLLGSGNITGGPILHLMTGNLSHQIEHHLFPDLPSNRYAQIAPRVRELCRKYDLPYRTGRLSRQVGAHWRKIIRLAFPGG
jgi:fatty acid desaturase